LFYSPKILILNTFDESIITVIFKHPTNIMNLKISIWISLIIGFNFSLQATTGCSAPSPQSAIFNNLSNDNITLSWEEVPDAVSYLLVIQDQEGINITSLVLTENT
jgi:hypothetical protein